MTNDREQLLRTLLTEFYDEVEQRIEERKDANLDDLRTSISDVITGLNNWNDEGLRSNEFNKTL